MIRRLQRSCVCLLVVAAVWVPASAGAQVAGEAGGDSVTGEWEGILGDSFGVLWRFERSDTGALIGFMGPATQGVATLPMQNLAIVDSRLSFTIATQGSYAGQISAAGIAGTWTNDAGVVETPLTMSRRVPPDPVSEEIASGVVGNWEGSLGDSFDVIWRFELSSIGTLVGFMGPAAQGIPTLPMQQLVVKDTEINFTISGQGDYVGSVTEAGIAGVWHDDEGALEAPLEMTRAKERQR